VLAIANGVFLYFLPDKAATDYAWSIKPTVNSAFMGAGYLSGLISVSLALFVARHWRSVRPIIIPFAVLGAGMLLATLLHTEKFKWDYPLTWVWTAVYIVIPPGVYFLWQIQEKVKSPTPPLDSRLNLTRWISWFFGGLLLLGGLGLFINPESFVTHWPGQITPLLVRAFAVWYMFKGCTLIACGLTAQQPHELFIAYAETATWNVLLLLLPLLYSGSMFTARTAYWPWIIFHGVLLLVSLGVTFQSYRLMQSSQQTL
jgi:hypothetical protein